MKNEPQNTEETKRHSWSCKIQQTAKQEIQYKSKENKTKLKTDLPKQTTTLTFQKKKKGKTENCD